MQTQTRNCQGYRQGVAVFLVVLFSSCNGNKRGEPHELTQGGEDGCVHRGLESRPTKDRYSVDSSDYHNLVKFGQFLGTADWESISSPTGEREEHVAFLRMVINSFCSVQSFRRLGCKIPESYEWDIVNNFSNVSMDEVRFIGAEGQESGPIFAYRVFAFPSSDTRRAQERFRSWVVNNGVEKWTTIWSDEMCQSFCAIEVVSWSPAFDKSMWGVSVDMYVRSLRFYAEFRVVSAAKPDPSQFRAELLELESRLNIVALEYESTIRQRIPK